MAVVTEKRLYCPNRSEFNAACKEIWKRAVADGWQKPEDHPWITLRRTWARDNDVPWPTYDRFFAKMRGPFEVTEAWYSTLHERIVAREEIRRKAVAAGWQQPKEDHLTALHRWAIDHGVPWPTVDGKKRPRPRVP